MALLTLPNGRGHGWRPDTPDNVNDRFLFRRITAPRQFPDVIALDPTKLSKPYDQGRQGSCTGHGTKGALEWSYRFHKGKDIDLSPGAAYLNARVIEASVKEDSGAEIRDVVKGAAKSGVPLSKYAKYNPDKLMTSLTKTAQKNALAHQVKVGYYRCRPRSVDDILTALLNNLPVIDGYTWYSPMSEAEFERTGVMPIPKPGDEVQGGHCNWKCYAHIPSRMFCLQNSYGEDYGAKHPISGQGGFVLMPFQWVEMGICSDIWAIEHE